MSNKVFSDCTCCFKPLKEEDIKINKENENYYYPICSECTERFINKIIKVTEKK